MDMEETSTPADFLDHEPTKQEKMEVGVKIFGDGTWPPLQRNAAIPSRKNPTGICVEISVAAQQIGVPWRIS